MVPLFPKFYSFSDSRLYQHTLIVFDYKVKNLMDSTSFYRQFLKWFFFFFLSNNLPSIAIGIA